MNLKMLKSLEIKEGILRFMGRILGPCIDHRDFLYSRVLESPALPWSWAGIKGKELAASETIDQEHYYAN
jgi:hypothetical protein